jgi:hypothetical protein
LNGEPYLAQLNLIIDTLHANTIPDIPDFLIKYGCVLLHRSHQIEVFSAATTVIAESLHWLAKIKQPYAKKFHDMLFENIMQVRRCFTINRPSSSWAPNRLSLSNGRPSTRTPIS